MIYDLESILEDTECTCGCIGMEPTGSYDYECPNCGDTGSVLFDER